MLTQTNNNNWRPTATLLALQARAQLYSQIRSFCTAWGVGGRDAAALHCKRGYRSIYSGI